MVDIPSEVNKLVRSIVEALDSAWRRADLRQSNVQRQGEVSEVV